VRPESPNPGQGCGFRLLARGPRRLSAAIGVVSAPSRPAAFQQACHRLSTGYPQYRAGLRAPGRPEGVALWCGPRGPGTRIFAQVTSELLSLVAAPDGEPRLDSSPDGTQSWSHHRRRWPMLQGAQRWPRLLMSGAESHWQRAALPRSGPKAPGAVRDNSERCPFPAQCAPHRAQTRPRSSERCRYRSPDR